MGKIVPIEPGARFGRWTVVQRTEGSGGKGKKVYYDCICDCGVTKSVCGTSLRNGSSTSCGCYQREVSSNIKVDLTGQRFGRLVVTSLASCKGERTSWLCQCDCGNECIVTTSDLRRKDKPTQSCGCLHKEQLGQRVRKDITGMRSGLLVALYPTEERSSGQGVMWMCQCDCGNTHKVEACDIIGQLTQSCGCKTMSKGEIKIAELLKIANISFEREKTFSSCVLPDTFGKPRFDFYVEDRYLIEYDGSQHFFAAGDGWNTQENYERTKQRDEYKNTWCKENNIPLIRIPYTHLKELKIEDLLLETSSFITK